MFIYVELTATTRPRYTWHPNSYYLARNYIINSLRPGDVHMLQWTRSSLFQVKSYHLFTAKPLLEPMLIYHQLEPYERTSVNFESKHEIFLSRKCIWKCCLLHVSHFVFPQFVKATTPTPLDFKSYFISMPPKACDLGSHFLINNIQISIAAFTSTLVEVMAWCHQAPSHYLSQCWPRSTIS